MRHLLLIMAIALLAVTSAHARKQSTSRNVRHATTALLQVGPSRDTIAVTDTAVRLSGYDKPLRATRESLFVTSSLDDTIRALRVKLDYYDMSGRRLHSRDVDITADIPPADTRCVDFKSWDTQKSFYYHLGPKPRRGTATPYKVEAHVVYVITDSR
mgnify:FL=1